MILPDVNVLVYSFREGAQDHTTYASPNAHLAGSPSATMPAWRPGIVGLAATKNLVWFDPAQAT